MVIRKYLTALLFLSLLPMKSSGQCLEKMFIMVHFEAGRDTTHPFINRILFDELGYPPDSLRTNGLYFQQTFWPSAVKIVQTADSFNVKLTLALQSQMAEYVLLDSSKVNTVAVWMKNGHELTVHHHGIGHVDWGGYTNRFQSVYYPDDSLFVDKYLYSGLYRGNMLQSYGYLLQLASSVNDSIISGTITDTRIDKPLGIKYLTKGGELQSDLISVPLEIVIPQETFYFLTHYAVQSFTKTGNDFILDDSVNYQIASERMDYVISNLGEIDSGEVMGVVFHAFDYYRFPDIYRNLFMAVSQSSIDNNTIRNLMNCVTTGMFAPDVAGPFVPKDFKLEQNYPNPFNPQTTIEYQIPVSGHVVLRVFNVLGQEVRTLMDSNQSADSYSLTWDGQDNFGKEAAGGIYLFQLRAKDFVQTKKLLLLK